MWWDPALGKEHKRGLARSRLQGTAKIGTKEERKLLEIGIKSEGDE